MVTEVDPVVEGQEEGVGISASSVSPILERERKVAIYNFSMTVVL